MDRDDLDAQVTACRRLLAAGLPPPSTMPPFLRGVSWLTDRLEALDDEYTPRVEHMFGKSNA